MHSAKTFHSHDYAFIIAANMAFRIEMSLKYKLLDLQAARRRDVKFKKYYRDAHPQVSLRT
jgi:hypothetical protein